MDLISGGVERFLLHNPERKLYHCGSFLDPEVNRAYIFHSIPFARQGLMHSLVELGDRKGWRIQRVLVDWDEFGDLIHVEVTEEMKP